MLIALLALAVTAPEVTLSGVVFTRSGRHAATLASEGRARSVIAGDHAFGCDIASIGENGVDLVCGGERRTVRMAPPGVVGTETVPTPAPAVEEPLADMTITRADLEARLDREMPRLMSETTLVPVTSRGQVEGFTLSRVPANTILESLGLKAGDVLVSVNDTPVDSFTTLVGLWPKLQTSGSVRARILRDGKPMDISVSVK